MGSEAEEEVSGGRRGGSHRQSNGMAAECGNKLLPTAKDRALGDCGARR